MNCGTVMRCVGIVLSGLDHAFTVTGKKQFKHHMTYASVAAGTRQHQPYCAAPTSPLQLSPPSTESPKQDNVGPAAVAEQAPPPYYAAACPAESRRRAPEDELRDEVCSLQIALASLAKYAIGDMVAYVAQFVELYQKHHGADNWMAAFGFTQDTYNGAITASPTLKEELRRRRESRRRSVTFVKGRFEACLNIMNIMGPYLQAQRECSFAIALFVSAQMNFANLFTGQDEITLANC